REERTPQISSFVIRVSLAELDTVPDHRAAGPGERLARRSAGDDLYTSVLDQLADALDHIWVGEIPVEREPGEVGRMGRHCRLVVVCSHHHAVPGLFQPEADAASTREEVRSQVRPLVAKGGCESEEGGAARDVVLVGREIEERTADQFDAVRGSPSGHGSLLCAPSVVPRRVGANTDFGAKSWV